MTGLETRVSNIEQRVSNIETRLEYVATKEDLGHLQASLLKWVSGMLISTAALTVTAGILINRIFA